MLKISLYGDFDNIIRLKEKITLGTDSKIAGIFSPGDTLITGNYIQPESLVFKSFDEMLESSDAVVFCDIREQELNLIPKAIRHSRHVFFKPHDFLSASALMSIQRLSEEAGVLLYLMQNANGSYLRDLLKRFIHTPEYIDSYAYLDSKRKNFREIRDALYHEISFVLGLSRSTCRRFFTAGVPYYSSNPYMLNVRMEFTNGAAANLTLNSFLEEDARFTELYSHSTMVRIDSKNLSLAVSSKEPLLFETMKITDFENTEFVEEIGTFLNMIHKGRFPGTQNQNGALLHLNTMEILKCLIPEGIPA